MRKKRILILPALLACTLLIAPIAAKAGSFDGTNMQLDLCNSGNTNAGACGTNTVNLNDGGSGTINFTAVSVGVWNVNSGNAFGSDGASGLMLPHLLDLSSFNATGAGGGTGSNALKLELTLTGLTVPLPNLAALQNIGGTLNFGGTSTITSQAWISNTNSAFCVTGCSSLTSLMSFTKGANQAFSGGTSGSGATVNPYSLTLVITLSSATSGHGSFDSSLDMIPEPATLSVLGTGLLALGTGLRKRLLRA